MIYNLVFGCLIKDKWTITPYVVYNKINYGVLLAYGNTGEI